MSNTTPTNAPTGPRRGAIRPLVLALAVVAALVAGVLVGRYTLPASGEQAQPGQTPSGNATSGAGAREHGPKTITKGVPSGFTRDREGAASAAMIAVQLQPAVAHGHADPEVVKTTWIAGSADQATRQLFSQTKASSADDRTSKAPADFAVKDFTGDQAVVELWVSSVGIGPGLGGRGVIRAQRWSTVTYRLVWEADTWKVAAVKTVDGPQPGTDDAAPAPERKQVAFYSFFITIE
ncbi:hypothetical protein [Nocardia sp. NRRL S-836]|uniref:hypothetical protein n=1 Tax=Nocardia sp. NRRL S-836 TaxID=1519492 RepID=UPI0006AFA5C0|nr:hypothetical protein [Nocardia sp. NRRL S-836]KOV81813.1 hypothetical protein ADL03_26935 [Nocardia sp. NRRL S-836]